MKAKPHNVELWICENCAYPCIVEDGGFFPEGNLVSASSDPAGRRIECGLCCHDIWIKIPFEPTAAGVAIWERNAAYRKAWGIRRGEIPSRSTLS